MTKYLLNGELIAEANDRSDDEFELTALRGKFLVELYNRVAETPVNKFSDNETAVRRTAAVLKEKIGMEKKTAAPKTPRDPKALRPGTNIQITHDLLARAEGATVDEVWEALKAAGRNIKKVSAASTIHWDLKQKGFGVVCREGRYFLSA